MTMNTLQDLIALGETEGGKEKLRVMLAELCGWRWITAEYHGLSAFVGARPTRTMFVEPKLALKDFDWVEIGPAEPIISFIHVCGSPDYPSDLNACAEVEMSLPTNDDPRGHGMSSRETFRHYLDLACHGRPHPVHATALQRTIALILTLQKA